MTEPSGTDIIINMLEISKGRGGNETSAGRLRKERVETLGIRKTVIIMKTQ